jgi:hypothetical protein
MSFADDSCLGPGTGLADFEYGGGTLYLDDQGHNELAGTRISHQSADQDKVYVAQVRRGGRGTPLQQWQGDVYLTIFIDKNKDGKAQIAGPAEYEFVVPRF